VELKWTPSALHDLDAAEHYIEQDNPTAAVETARRILDAVEYLEQYPALGRAGRLRGTRELIISGTPFLVIYRTRAGQVQILRVLHHAQKWP